MQKHSGSLVLLIFACWCLIPGNSAHGVEPVTLTVVTELTAAPVLKEWIADFQEESLWITFEFQGFHNEVWEENLLEELQKASDVLPLD